MNDRIEKSSNAPTIGGWTPFGPLDARSRAVFEAATKGLVGVQYTPKEVSTQVVAGTNYRFRCDARVVYPDAPSYSVTMEIYQPLDGPPVITRITRTGEDLQGATPMPGGWTPFCPVDAKAKAVFAAAMEGFVGVDYTPLKVSTQVVAGTNYRFICDARIVVPAAPTYKALLIIYAPLDGKPQLVDIHPI